MKPASPKRAAMRRGVLALALVAALSGCLQDQPDSIGLSFGSERASPVVLTALAVNGQPLNVLVPEVVGGLSDEVMPRTNGLASLALPPGEPGRIRLDLTWVELLTGRGWRATADLPLDELWHTSYGAPQVGPVFGRNGRLTVTSDPPPDAAGNQPRRDVLALCATRSPDADTDYRRDPDSLPTLRDTLSYYRPAPTTAPACPPPAR